jgi:antitoxin ParD1/3/4
VACKSSNGYIPDLIRRDNERVEREVFARLGDKLQNAFGKPEASYQALTAAEVITRNTR